MLLNLIAYGFNVCIRTIAIRITVNIKVLSRACLRGCLVERLTWLTFWWWSTWSGHGRTQSWYHWTFNDKWPKHHRLSSRPATPSNQTCIIIIQNAQWNVSVSFVRTSEPLCRILIEPKRRNTKSERREKKCQITRNYNHYQMLLLLLHNDIKSSLLFGLTEGEEGGVPSFRSANPSPPLYGIIPLYHGKINYHVRGST